MSDSPRTPAEHVQSGRVALDKLVEGLDTVRTEHARAYREVCDSLAALVALADRQREIITEQHSRLWLVGLDLHEGEEPQSVESSVRNLRSLLAGGAGDE